MKTRWIGLGTYILLLIVLAQASESRLPIIKEPPPFKDVAMPVIYHSDIDYAIDAGSANAAKREAFEEDMITQRKGIISSNTISAQGRHQRNNYFYQESIPLTKEEQIFEGASSYLKDKKKLDNEQASIGLAKTPLDGTQRSRNAVAQCQLMYQVKCPTYSKFRTADGSCNNQNNKIWGKSFTCFERLLPPAYFDGVSSPRSTSYGLPNPRGISRIVHAELEVLSNSYSHMTMQWGQFLDHDLTITPMSRAGRNMEMIECCNITGTPHPECFPISLRNDDFYRQFGQTCMNFVRSASCTTCTLGPRQQTNQLTAFVDGSNIYGSRENDTRALRTLSGGELKSQTFNVFEPSLASGRRVFEALPRSQDTANDQCSTARRPCFQAGDERVNEQPGLTAMHTLWLRQHNRIARTLRRLADKPSDEEIFQHTRRIIGAQLQFITYGEFLPVVLGPAYMNHFDLYPRQSGYTTYNRNVNPSILTEFSTAAYRFGHTLIHNRFAYKLQQGDGIDLKDNFFNPDETYSGNEERLLYGLLKQEAQFFDRHIVTAVTNHLYKKREDRFGMDLPALNIQRSRDHGIPGYTKYVELCFGVTINSFDDLYEKDLMSENNAYKLYTAYRNPEDIDLFTGGVSEFPLDGGVVGPTFGCIIGMQFKRLKYGDRYYFEHGRQAGSFTEVQLNKLRTTTLALVLCLNTEGLKGIPKRAFAYNSETVYCRDAYDIDYSDWADGYGYLV